MPSLRAPCAMQHALSSHGCALLVCICRYREKHWFKRAWQHNSDAQAFTEVKERLDRAILDLHFGIQVDQRADQQRWEQVRVCHRRTCSNSMPLAMSTRTPSTQRAAESTVITHARSHARTHAHTHAVAHAQTIRAPTHILLCSSTQCAFTGRVCAC